MTLRIIQIKGKKSCVHGLENVLFLKYLTHGSDQETKCYHFQTLVLSFAETKNKSHVDREPQRAPDNQNLKKEQRTMLSDFKTITKLQ